MCGWFGLYYLWRDDWILGWQRKMPVSLFLLCSTEMYPNRFLLLIHIDAWIKVEGKEEEKKSCWFDGSACLFSVCRSRSFYFSGFSSLFSYLGYACVVLENVWCSAFFSVFSLDAVYIHWTRFHQLQIICLPAYQPCINTFRIALCKRL